ncbi:hypothetical protein AQJ30_24095 [Streptomyces longwoodensis]|uniref:Uncharacterized protein n=1 Tax=Streptomyces longwoodensis TaxID=68231 RepID=A0A101QTK2_9ACTN|nr:hypothetical protein AQJ30_24095 [Streptomyces longwoodensis]
MRCDGVTACDFDLRLEEELIYLCLRRERARDLMETCLIGVYAVGFFVRQFGLAVLGRPHHTASGIPHPVLHFSFPSASPIDLASSGYSFPRAVASFFLA